MDKNSVIGLLLIGVILVTFSIWNAPDQAEIAKQRAKADSARTETVVQPNEAVSTPETLAVTPAQEQTVLAAGDSAATDSVLQAELQFAYGVFSNAATGDDDYFTVENEVMKLRIAKKGGRIAAVELKEYRSYDSSALMLFDEATSKFGLSYFTKGRRTIETDALFFEPVGEEFEVSGEDERRFAMRLYDNSRSRYIEYSYGLKGNSYLVDFDLKMVGMNQLMDNSTEEVTLNWVIDSPSQEKSKENQERTTTTYYKYKDGDVDYISETSYEKEDLVASVKWVAFKQQYFTAAIIADDHFVSSQSDVETKAIEDNEQYVKTMGTHLSVPFEQMSEQQHGMTFYFGPLHFQTLEDLNLDLEALVPLGWGIFGWVNEWAVIPIFNWLDAFDLSYGIIILLLTIIIKLILFPITYKTYLSSAKMRVLKPEINEINEKHKDDAMKKQQAVMALYKKTGVNPFSGCIPMLIQFPILLAMFKFFPASIELRQESFLWADDLSTYDSIFSWETHIPLISSLYGNHISLFTLLMAISMVFYTRMNSSMMGGAGGPGGEMQATQMKIMMYLMPIMMLVFFNKYSAGLSYYYLVANIISMGQQYVIKNWFVNEEDILKKIEMNKKKPAPKKSKFQKRLEEMAKQRGQQLPKR
jgi:YidC/Oxa1 family membrane protein insertase